MQDKENYESKEGVVKSTSGVREFNGVKQIGFTLDTDPTQWYNMSGEEKELGLILNNILSRGAKVKFDYDGIALKNLVMLEKPKFDTTEKKDSGSKYIVNISGKDFMTYEGLLNKAHEKKENFNMEIVESFVSADMKMAWCKVRITADGRIFDGFGSSTPENTGKMTSDHPIEMAHTRAKGRALRDYLNIGQAMAEELKK